MVHDDGAEMAHDEGVDTAAAAGQKHARLHNTRPQGTSNIRPLEGFEPVQTTYIKQHPVCNGSSMSPF